MSGGSSKFHVVRVDEDQLTQIFLYINDKYIENERTKSGSLREFWVSRYFQY